MTKNINLPDIGADAVEVTGILVAVGDQVVVEQALITVEGDKTSMEIPAPQAGRVTDIKVQVGDKIGTDHLIMLFEVDGSTATPALSKLDQGTFHVTAQTSVSDSTERPSLKEALPIGQSDTSPREIMTEPPVSTTATGWANNPAYAHATPMVRRLAREFGIDLSQINGTGHKARVLKQDLQDFVKKVVTEQGNPDKGSSLALLPWPTVDFEQFGATERIALSRINKATGANLQRNAVVIPHVTQWETADITELEAFRKQQNQEAERQQLGFKLTPIVLIMKAVAKALQQMPRFNSSLSEDQQWLIVKKYIHLGVAVDTPNGLVVPVVRNVDQKGLIELSQELTDLSKKARAGKLSRTEMLGGCFTISSLGGIGGTAFTPIVNAPEVAILGVSRSNIQPQWDGKQFLPRLMLPLSLSYDHRVIDGADGARFITALSHLLSDIRRLLI